MIEEVVSVELPVHERLVVRKNRLMNKDENHSKNINCYRYSWR